jgi:hypothetical protein
LLLLLLGGVAIAGAAPEAKPAGTTARILRFEVRFSPFHLVDADGDGAASLGDYPVFHDILLRTARRSVTRVAPARSSTSSRG